MPEPLSLVEYQIWIWNALDTKDLSNCPRSEDTKSNFIIKQTNEAFSVMDLTLYCNIFEMSLIH